MPSKLKFYTRSSTNWRKENNLNSIEWDEYKANILFGVWIHIIINVLLGIGLGITIGLNL